MDFRILGPLEVLDEGRKVALGGSKQRALLGLLLFHANETLTADRLIDELWGERPPATAAKTVQAHVSRLRKTLAVGDGAVRHARARLRARGSIRDAWTRAASSGWSAEGRSALATARPEPAARDAAKRRSRCGAGRRWRTSRMSRSRSARSLGSRSCGSPRWSS